MCKEMDKDVVHLLLHCGLTMRLWWDMFRWFVTSWAMPKTVEELIGRAGEGGEDIGNEMWSHLC